MMAIPYRPAGGESAYKPASVHSKIMQSQPFQNAVTWHGKDIMLPASQQFNLLARATNSERCIRSQTCTWLTIYVLLLSLKPS
eukprot:1161215-Pelagomonas_calceolata.AAC.17